LGFDRIGSSCGGNEEKNASPKQGFFYELKIVKWI